MILFPQTKYTQNIDQSKILMQEFMSKYALL